MKSGMSLVNIVNNNGPSIPKVCLSDEMQRTLSYLKVKLETIHTYIPLSVNAPSVRS